MASSYGWDWGPDLAGVGIWKGLRIESWSGVRIASVRPLATLDTGTGAVEGVLEVQVELEWAPDSGRPVTVGVEVGDGEAERQAEVEVDPGTDRIQLEPAGARRRPVVAARLRRTTALPGPGLAAEPGRFERRIRFRPRSTTGRAGSDFVTSA